MLVVPPLLVVPAPPLSPIDAEEAAYAALLADDPEPELAPEIVARPERPVRTDEAAPAPGATRFGITRPTAQPAPKLNKVRNSRSGKESKPPRGSNLPVPRTIFKGGLKVVGGGFWLVAGLATGRLFFYAPVLMFNGCTLIFWGFLGYHVEDE